MQQSICILGRQPELGMVELESLYGATVLTRIGEGAVRLDMPIEKIEFSRHGGSLKLCRILITLDTIDWQEVQAYLIETIPKHLVYLPEGKLHLGISVYGLSIQTQQLQATALTVKRVIKNEGRSVRIVLNNDLQLSSAQVLHNHLTSPLGWELVLIKDGDCTILAQTAAVQDITAYARRDQARPKRDAYVGMLPPKLAQIIINLAVGNLGKDKKDRSSLTVLDPFCGSGVILQEALLMGYNIYGTDLQQRMVDYSDTNLQCLFGSKSYSLKSTDSTSATWHNFDVVASETYLGRPINSLPTPDNLQKIITDVNIVLKKFLINLAKQTKPPFRLCLAVPAWKTPNEFKHLPLIDQLTDLGYNLVKFDSVLDKALIYHRPGQVVARQLLILVRI